MIDVPVFVAPASSGNGRSALPSYRHSFVADDLIPEPDLISPARETLAQRACRFQAMVDSGQAGSRAEVARMLGCSRAWVTRVLGRSANGSG